MHLPVTISLRIVFHQIIRRDLAARNVLVGEGEKCKVTDFGMSRNVQEDEIYTRKSRIRMLPRYYLRLFLSTILASFSSTCNC